MNYFNYYTEIEDAFVRRRGKHLFLSPLDWALMETWKEQGIPLHIVLRGVEKSFDSFESKPRKRSVKSLLYCQEEVEAQYAEWLETRVGSSSTTERSMQPAEADTKMPFSLAAIRDHIQRSRRSLVEMAETRSQGAEDDLSEALGRVAKLLEAIENDLTTSTTFDSRRLEDSLTGLERTLADAIFSVVTAAELEKMKVEIKSQLKPYRSQMESAAYDQTLNNLLLKRLREQFSVPRLSLFYL